MKNIKAHIVTGLGYGDEGKGITTDFLASKLENAIVIRYSGGQQAGHTVMVNGVKHIHSNFGSGSLRGVPTYFSEHTTFYPVTIARELEVLTKKGFKPNLILHPLAKMTTPFDVFANRFDSKNLSDGSCGLGIGKTMKRNESPFKLYAVDLLNYDILLQKVISIESNFYDFIDKYGLSTQEKREIGKELQLFFDAIKDIAWQVKDYNVLTAFDNLIFEGSQGIMLDMDHGVFPNVTFANTTSKNAHEILDKLNIRNRNGYYITRCYSTRHGSGDFKEEELNLINNEEEINVFNEYQKEFKVASLDYNLLNYAIAVDNIYSSGKYVNKNLVITCLDQLPDFEFDFSLLDEEFDNVYESHSPDSKDYKIVSYEETLED